MTLPHWQQEVVYGFPTPRAEPLMKRHAYVGEDERSPLPFATHSSVALQASAFAAAASVVTDLFSFWRGVDPSPSHIPQDRPHVVKPNRISALKSWWSLASPMLRRLPIHYGRAALWYSTELLLFVGFVRLLRSTGTIPTTTYTTSEAMEAASASAGSRNITALTPSYVVTERVRSGEVVRGVLAGGLAGSVSSLLAFPYRVMEATVIEHPQCFRRPLDVVRAAWQENRRLLYRGVWVGSGVAMGSGALRGAAMFGGYALSREDGVYRHPVVLFLYCFASCLAGDCLQYPWLMLRQEKLRYYHLSLTPFQSSGKRPSTAPSPFIHHVSQGKPRVTYRMILAQMRRTHGISFVWKGYAIRRPCLRALPPALLLYTYDVLLRRAVTKASPGGGSRAVSPAQSLTNMRMAAAPLPEYEFGRK